ncbi:MAG: pentapeptide repeat-containing protein [Bacteriovoracaceae bacterium]
MSNQNLEKSGLYNTERYQLIAGESLETTVVSEQILAGSKIALCTYEKVVFSESEFYGCEFQGVIFQNCVFENCKFVFSHFRKCKFINCSFINCSWSASSATNSIYEDCDLDMALNELTLGNGNDVFFTKDTHTTDIYVEMVA